MKWFEKIFHSIYDLLEMYMQKVITTSRRFVVSLATVAMAWWDDSKILTIIRKVKIVVIFQIETVAKNRSLIY